MVLASLRLGALPAANAAPARFALLRYANRPRAAFQMRNALRVKPVAPEPAPVPLVTSVVPIPAAFLEFAQWILLARPTQTAPAARLVCPGPVLLVPALPVHLALTVPLGNLVYLDCVLPLVALPAPSVRLAKAACQTLARLRIVPPTRNVLRARLATLEHVQLEQLLVAQPIPNVPLVRLASPTSAQPAPPAPQAPTVLLERLAPLDSVLPLDAPPVLNVALVKAAF